MLNGHILGLVSVSGALSQREKFRNDKNCLAVMENGCLLKEREVKLFWLSLALRFM